MLCFTSFAHYKVQHELKSHGLYKGPNILDDLLTEERFLLSDSDYLFR